MKAKKYFWLVVVIVLFVIVAGSIYKSYQPQEAQIIPSENQPTIGNANSKIHVVAFEDLKCVNCAAYNNRFYPEIKEKYIDTNKIRYTTIPLAFIPGSLPAANAALCLNQQNTLFFYEFVDNIYLHQPDEALDWATNNNLISFAQSIKGVDLAKLQSCMNAKTFNAQVESNLKLAAEIMGGTVSTPSLYVNGIAVQDMSQAGIQKAIEGA